MTVPRTNDTKMDYEDALYAISQACQRHGIVLVATCGAAGVYGEITIVESKGHSSDWPDVRDIATTGRVVQSSSGKSYVVDGAIGKWETPESS